MKAHQLKALRTGGPVPAVSEGPKWVWGENALERSAEALAELPGPYLLVGESKLLSPMRKRISGAWIEAGLEIQPLSFPEGSECCEEQAEAIAATAASKQAGTLVAWGGGKCIDTVKWAGLLSGRAVATVPSCAATCACATRMVVAHSPSGEVLDLVELKCPPDLCIVDFELMRSAPARTLKAGMADTLAKLLEWSAVEDPQGPGADEARRAQDIVLDPSSTEEEIWEANLRLSAAASNLGGAPAAAAHSFCSGISLAPESRQWLHGEWAGLGLLFQAHLLGDEPGTLEAWLSVNGLPLRIPLKPAAEAASRILREDESIHAMRGAQGLALPMIQDALSAISE